MPQNNQRHIITASEIGEFAYCQKAWFLKRCGEAAESPDLKTGTAFHARHEARVSQAARLNRTGKQIGVIVVILFIVMTLLWTLTEISR